MTTTSGVGFTYREQEQERYLIETVRDLFSKHGPIDISFKRHKSEQTRSQQNLYWEWMMLLHKHFKKDSKCTEKQKQDMHDLMCHKFLGYVGKLVGHTKIVSLRTLTWPAKMDTGEMSSYMKKVEAWSAQHGCRLPVPEDNDYAQYRELA